MDPRINRQNAVAVVEEPSPLIKYLYMAKAGFKRALSYELLAFLSMFGLARMVVKNESTWGIKIRHLLFMIISYI